MGRPRKHDRQLPARVYLRAGRYYYADPVTGRWISLGKTVADMTAAYARIAQPPRNECGTLSDIIDRYTREVLPGKAAKTQVDQSRQLALLRRVFGAMAPEAVTAQHLYQFMDRRRTAAGIPAPIAARQEM
jgi:hypothetical protein